MGVEATQSTGSLRKVEPKLPDEIGNLKSEKDKKTGEDDIRRQALLLNLAATAAASDVAAVLESHRRDKPAKDLKQRDRETSKLQLPTPLESALRRETELREKIASLGRYEDEFQALHERAQHLPEFTAADSDYSSHRDLIESLTSSADGLSPEAQQLKKDYADLKKRVYKEHGTPRPRDIIVEYHQAVSAHIEAQRRVVEEQKKRSLNQQTSKTKPDTKITEPTHPIGRRLAAEVGREATISMVGTLPAALTAAKTTYDKKFTELRREGVPEEQAHIIAMADGMKELGKSLLISGAIAGGTTVARFLGKEIHLATTRADEVAKALGKGASWFTKVAANPTVAKWAGRVSKVGGRIVGPIIAGYQIGSVAVDTKTGWQDKKIEMSRIATSAGVSVIPVVGEVDIVVELLMGKSVTGAVIDGYAQNPQTRLDNAKELTFEEKDMLKALAARHKLQMDLNMYIEVDKTTEQIDEVYKGVAAREFSVLGEILAEKNS